MSYADCRRLNQIRIRLKPNDPNIIIVLCCQRSLKTVCFLLEFIGPTGKSFAVDSDTIPGE